MTATVLIPGGRPSERAAVVLPRAREHPFTDRDRRIATKLAIPWSVRGLTHRLWVDEFTESKGEQEVYDELVGLAMRGLVVNLGSRPTPAKVVHAAQSHPEAIPFPDENAGIYARRMALPHRAYRCEGDTWMLTKEGLEQIKAPTVESRPLTPSEVREVIRSEFDRVMWDYDPDRATGAMLHPDVFYAWLPQVVQECERVWGVRPVAPHRIAGGASGWTDVFENTILDQENQKTQAPALIAPWYMALGIVAFSDTDTGATHGDATRLPTYVGYAAKDVPAADMAAASAGSSANTAAIQFAACSSGTSVIVTFGNNSVVTNTSGIFRKWGDCTSTTVSSTQTPAQFAIGAYTTTAN
jgi:hypothetical protein